MQTLDLPIISLLSFTATVRRLTITLFCYHKYKAYTSLLVRTVVTVAGVSGTRIGSFNITVDS